MKPILELLKDFYIQRIIIYAFITFFSVFVIGPLGDLRIRFTDDHCSRCILYTDIESVMAHPNSTDVSSYHIRFGEQEVCEYGIAISSVFCLIYPLITGIVYVFMYRKDSKEVSAEQKLDLSHFLFLIHIITELCVIVLVLVTAGMISAGFEHLCQSITEGIGKHMNSSSCSDAQDFNVWQGYDGSNFHVALSVATAGSWFLFVSWFAQGLLGVWKLWRLGMLPVIFSMD